MYDESWELIPKRVDREEVPNRDLLRSTLGTKFELGGTIKSHLDRSDKILPVEGWPNRLPGLIQKERAIIINLGLEAISVHSSISDRH